MGNSVITLPFTGMCAKCNAMILEGTTATHVQGAGMCCPKCFPLPEGEVPETRSLGELQFAAEMNLKNLFASLRILRHQYSLGKSAATETLKAIALRKKLQTTLTELDQLMATMEPASV